MTTVIRARDLLAHQPAALITLLPDSFTLEFDNGETSPATRNRTYFSRFFWEVHVRYPRLALQYRHYVGSLLEKGPLSSSTHTTLMSRIRKDCCDTYGFIVPEQRRELDLLMTHVFNRAYNQAMEEAEPYVTSLDYEDFLDLADYEPIRTLVINTEPNDEAIRTTYKKIMQILDHDPGLSNNPVVRAVRAKMVNANQILQCIAFRGRPSEVDGAVFENIIKDNYTHGLQDPFSYFSESRSAAKSMLLTEAPLQQSEHFSRTLRMITMAVRQLEYVDCGSKDYMSWTVNGPRYDDHGNRVYPGDLDFMVGKYYYDDNDKMLEIVGDETHLYGKTIRMRSVMNCKLENPHNVCMHCYGGLHVNVSPFSNLGHLCSTTMTQQSSQSVLSNKHLDSSSVVAMIILSALSAKYFSQSDTKKGFVLRPDLKGKVRAMRVAQTEAYSLIDIKNVPDPEDIAPSRISSIKAVDLVIDISASEFVVANVVLSNSGREARLSKEFLLYVREKGWVEDDRGFFEFDLTDWDFGLPVMKMPAMEYSYSDHAKSISAMIESTVKNVTNRLEPGSPAKTLKEIFELVNSKLRVNMAALEVIVYAFTIQSENNYRLGRNSPNKIMGIRSDILENRSLSAALCYEDQLETLYDPRSFFVSDRPNIMFDCYFMPEEVVEHYAELGIR